MQNDFPLAYYSPLVTTIPLSSAKLVQIFTSFRLPFICVSIAAIIILITIIYRIEMTKMMRMVEILHPYWKGK